jgi:hypothetical protein
MPIARQLYMSSFCSCICNALSFPNHLSPICYLLQMAQPCFTAVTNNCHEGETKSNNRCSTCYVSLAAAYFAFSLADHHLTWYFKQKDMDARRDVVFRVRKPQFHYYVVTSCSLKSHSCVDCESPSKIKTYTHSRSRSVRSGIGVEAGCRREQSHLRLSSRLRLRCICLMKGNIYSVVIIRTETMYGDARITSIRRYATINELIISMRGKPRLQP